jgi:stage IV sporulation protein FB
MSFKIRDVEFSFTFWFFAGLLALLIFGGEALAWYLILPMLAHECGHAAIMGLCGIPIRGVHFRSFGVEIETGDTATTSYGKDIAIALGGVAANLILALILHLFFFHSMRVMLLVAVNIALAMFHLIPIGSLDGGQALRLLLERFGNPEMAWQVSRFFSFLLLVPLFAAAIFLIICGTANLSLLLVCLYLAGTVIFMWE